MNIHFILLWSINIPFLLLKSPINWQQSCLRAEVTCGSCRDFTILVNSNLFMQPIKKNKWAWHAWENILKQQHTERNIKYESSWSIQKNMITAAHRKEKKRWFKTFGRRSCVEFLAAFYRQRAESPVLGTSWGSCVADLSAVAGAWR